MSELRRHEAKTWKGKQRHFNIMPVTWFDRIGRTNDVHYHMKDKTQPGQMAPERRVECSMPGHCLVPRGCCGSRSGVSKTGTNRAGITSMSIASSTIDE